MIKTINNNSMSYIFTIKYGQRYENEIVITIITLFFVLGNYQIETLTYSRIYLKWLGYNDGKKI